MQFPMFDGTHPKIWIDKCNNSETLRVSAAAMHLEGNATKWWQAYKQNHKVANWEIFCAVLQEKFGADDFRSAISDLIQLKQTGSVEDYTAAF